MMYLLTKESAYYDGQDIEDLILAWSNNLEFILNQLEYSEYYTSQIIFLPENGGKTESIEYIGITNHMDENFLKYPPFLFDKKMIDETYPILNKWCDGLREYLRKKKEKEESMEEARERKEYERLKKKFE